MLVLCERLDCIYLRRGVLVAFNPVQRILGSVNCELRRVIATAKNQEYQYLPVGRLLYLESDMGTNTYKKPCPMFTIG